MADADPKIYINVVVSERERARIEREERSWTSARLVLLTFATLTVAFVVLYLMASTYSETYWHDWLIPG